MNFEPHPDAPAEATVFLPVVCPTCGATSESEFPISVVMIGLAEWHQMAFYAECHSTPWSATPLELYNARTFLGEAWMEAHWGARTVSYTPRFNDRQGNAPS